MALESARRRAQRMARLENKPGLGLPPAPAPTRRSANPSKFSATARKREHGPESAQPSLEDILDELQTAAGQRKTPEHPEPPGHEPPAQPVAHEPQLAAKRGGGVWPLFVLLIAVGIIFKVVSQALETGEWRGAIAPIIAILFVAHGWWRMRQRRDEKAQQHTDDAD